MENEEYAETTVEETMKDSKQKETMIDNNKENEDDGVENKSAVSEYETYEGSSDRDEFKEILDNDEHDFESDGSVVIEREEGDGQESVSTKKVDDDEDKKNPQYIPKRGTFYEHDDRTLEDSSEEKPEATDKTDKQNKKNVWMEKKERWGHDRYNDNEQAPKSRTELVAIYGYDIRNEDGPPKARRRRRYGRGPNKYTRTWEDEDAYKPAKPIKIVKPKGKRREDYATDEFESSDYKEEPVPIENSNTEEVKPQHTSPLNVENKAPPSVSPKYRQEPPRKPNNNAPSDYQNYRPPNQKIGTGRVPKSKPDNKNEIKDSDYTGFTRSRQFRNSKSEQKVIPKNYTTDNYPKRSNSNEDCTESIQKDLNQMNIQEEYLKPNRQNNRQNSVPPRLQTEQKGPKRYSSLRQRSLPETAGPTFTQAANYYASEYNQGSQPAQQQALLQHGTTPVPQIPPPPLPTMPQQVPANPILQAPPQFAATFPQAPPPFLPPAVPTASFIPQQAAPIINYVQSPAQFPQAPQYQSYQHQPFNAVNQAAELYQCQGGTTYYSTQNQHIAQRAVPLKRPKAAIPIVPPPPQEPRGRGRFRHPREISLPEEEMCETGMNDTSNIYEDSVVYVQQ